MRLEPDRCSLVALLDYHFELLVTQSILIHIVQYFFITLGEVKGVSEGDRRSQVIFRWIQVGEERGTAGLASLAIVIIPLFLLCILIEPYFLLKLLQLPHSCLLILLIVVASGRVDRTLPWFDYGTDRGALARVSHAEAQHLHCVFLI